MPDHSRRLTLLLGLVFASIGLAGCEEADPADRSPGSSAGEARSLDEPPELQVGEWWTMEIDADLAGAEYQATVVVTDGDEETAVLGTAADDFSHDFFVVHAPPLGELHLETFAWHVMWDDFEALRFPLEEGRTWMADYHGSDVEAEVTGTENGIAHVTMEGEEEQIELAYDADRGMVTEFRSEALQLGFRVTDHGFDYEGRVKTPTGIELALFEGWPPQEEAEEEEEHHVPEQDGPEISADVDVGASQGSMGLILTNDDADEDRSYRIAATAPDGTVFEKAFSPPANGPPLLLESFGHDVVDGTWELEFDPEVRGALAELFTYDLAETRLGEP